MKINIILSALANSGGSKVVDIYAELLSEMGHDVVIYRPCLAFNMHRYQSEVKNRIHQIYCTFKALGVRAKSKGRKYDKWIPFVSNSFLRNADVTIATAWPTAYKVAKLNESCGKKWYFVQDYEIWDNKELGQKSYLLPLNIIVISTWINNQLKNELDIGPFPVVMNGINTHTFSCKTVENHKELVFLMLNHTLEKKGVQFGISVFERINNRFPNTKLKMFGMCSSDNIPSNIEYHQNPSISELVELYRSSDFFIFPSKEEGWGLTPLEAMACGCVVIGTNTGFVLDVGEHMKNMMISEVDDLQSMEMNIIRLIEDKDLYSLIRKEGIMLTKRLDWRNSACRLEELIKK